MADPYSEFQKKPDDPYAEFQAKVTPQEKPIGEQPASVGGVLQTMGNQAGRFLNAAVVDPIRGLSQLAHPSTMFPPLAPKVPDPGTEPLFTNPNTPKPAGIPGVQMQGGERAPLPFIQRLRLALGGGPNAPAMRVPQNSTPFDEMARGDIAEGLGHIAGPSMLPLAGKAIGPIAEAIPKIAPVVRGAATGAWEGATEPSSIHVRGIPVQVPVPASIASGVAGAGAGHLIAGPPGAAVGGTVGALAPAVRGLFRGSSTALENMRAAERVRPAVNVERPDIPEPPEFAPIRAPLPSGRRVGPPPQARVRPAVNVERPDIPEPPEFAPIRAPLPSGRRVPTLGPQPQAVDTSTGQKLESLPGGEFRPQTTAPRPMATATTARPVIDAERYDEGATNPEAPVIQKEDLARLVQHIKDKGYSPERIDELKSGSKMGRVALGLEAGVDPKSQALTTAGFARAAQQIRDEAKTKANEFISSQIRPVRRVAQ